MRSNPRSDERSREQLVMRLEQSIVNPGSSVPLLLGDYEPKSRKALNLQIYPVGVADYEIHVHRDRANDQTLWCKVHNRSSEKIYIVAKVLGGSDADTPAA